VRIFHTENIIEPTGGLKRWSKAGGDLAAAAEGGGGGILEDGMDREDLTERSGVMVCEGPSPGLETSG